MDDPLLVRGFERLRDLPRDGEGLVQRNRPACDAVCQRRPLDELEDQRADLAAIGFIFLKPVDAADVGVVQRREDLGFALEASEPLWVVGEQVREDLRATSRSSFVSRARTTMPMPPAPSSPVTSYGPSRSPALRGTERL